MSRRVLARAGILVLAGIVGSVATIAIWGRTATSAATAPPPPSTASVVRTDLTSTVLTEGTLGYAPTNPVVNRLQGTYTALPTPGTVIQPGGVLYRVDNMPVVLMSGATPAWRGFASGMSDGPDVGELQANLIALGYAGGLLTTEDDHFSVLTQDAVERWQSANGLPSNGQVALGQIVFEQGAVLVGAQSVALGQGATPGDLPFEVTTTQRIVTVPLGPDLPPVNVGESVSIILPTNATTPGVVASIAPAPPSSSQSQGSTSGSQGSTGSDQPSASSVVTVLPTQPAATGTESNVALQVSLTSQAAKSVLAAPIAALLALAGGGYGVEVVTASGSHHLVGVVTGIFTGSQVQISGPGIAAGTRVVVAQ